MIGIIDWLPKATVYSIDEKDMKFNKELDFIYSFVEVRRMVEGFFFVKNE